MKKISTSKLIVCHHVLVISMLVFFSNKAQGQKKVNEGIYNSYSTKTNIFNGITTINFKKNGSIFKIEYKGEIKVSDNDKDILNISNKGYLILVEYANSPSMTINHRVTIESGRSDNKIINYFSGSSRKDYYKEGRKWLASVLPTIVRNTPLGMESRIAHFYKIGGANNVVSEIKNRIQDHHTKAIYLKELLKYDCTPSELVKIVETAGSEIKSSSGLAEFLKENQNSFLVNTETIIAYIKAAENIHSSSNLASVVVSMIANSKISDQWLSNVTVLGKKINSNSELGNIAKKLISNRELNNENIETILILSKENQSNSGLVEVFKKMAKKANLLSDYQLIKILRTAPECIQSSSNLSETLIAFSGKVKKSSEKVKEAYRESAKQINSSSNYASAMKAIY